MAVRTRQRKKPQAAASSANGTTSSDVSKEGPELNGTTSSPGHWSPSSSSRWEVVHRMHLPKFLSDNEFLIKGHRPVLNSVVECAKSTFRIHTETVNIWTHLVGSLTTALVALYFWTHPLDWHHRLTFSGFFIGAVICMGGSTIYHTLMCHSEPVCKYMAKVDYCGILILIVSSFPPWLHYGFYCDFQLKSLYTGLIVGLGLISVLAVVRDEFGKPGYFKLRAGLFMTLGLFGLLPGIHFILVNGLWDGMLYTKWLLIMAALYLIGGAIYAMRIPERLYPGKFDIWLHSHQILHLCVMGGVFSCYTGITSLAADRKGIANFCDTYLNSSEAVL